MSARVWANGEASTIAERLYQLPLFSEHIFLTVHHVLHSKPPAGDGGCKLLARCRKLGVVESALVGGLAEAMTNLTATPAATFVIVYSADEWSYLDDNQREALVYHELCHIDPIDGKLRGHEFSGFAGEIIRYGSWHNGLRIAQRAFALDAAPRAAR